MLNFYGKWFILQLKNTFKSLIFYFTALLIIISTYLVVTVGNNIADEVRVLIYNDDSVEARYIIDGFINGSIPGYSFKEAESEADIRDEILRGRYSLGLVFDKSLDDAISSGNYNGNIRIIQPVASSEGYVLKEIIYPYIQRAGANNTLKGYIENYEKDIPEDIEYKILRVNSDFINDSELSIFKIIETDVAHRKETAGISFEKICIAILLFFACLLIVYDSILVDNNFYRYQKLRDRVILVIEKILSEIIIYIIICIATVCVLRL